MEDCEPYHSANEFEVIQVFRVDARVRVDLESIIVMSGIFEKAIEWIKHFVG